MKIVEGIENIQNLLKDKEARLDEARWSNSINRIEYANSYLPELYYVKTFLSELHDLEQAGNKVNVKLVSYLYLFRKIVAKADLATLEFDGDYCKIAMVYNYPSDRKWLIYASRL